MAYTYTYCPRDSLPLWLFATLCPLFLAIINIINYKQLLMNGFVSASFKFAIVTLHSTERLHNHILLTVEAGSCAILALLDLSASFDIPDHDILIRHLEAEFGRKGPVLKWFNSYLRDSSFSVRIGNC